MRARRPPTPPVPLPGPVHNRGHRLPALLLGALLALLPAAPLPALGQDGGKPKAEGVKEGEGKKGDGKKDEGKKDGGKKDGGKKKEKGAEPKEKSGEQVLLEALGAAWRKGDGKTLAARFPAKRKVALRLPGSEAGDYRAEQAKSLLEEYFKGRSFTKVELRSVKETAGTFRVEYVRTADRRTVRAELLLVVGVEGEKRVLVSAREGP